MNQYVVSVIRTWVPIIIGWLISQLLVLGVVVDSDNSTALTTSVTSIVIGLYYALVRWVETKFPQVGLLLGYIKQPVYVDPNKTPAQQDTEVSSAVQQVAKTT